MTFVPHLSFRLVLFVLFALYVASVLYVHLRGRARLRFGRQLFDHSGVFAPYNVLMYAFSAVPSKPILDRPRFPHLDPLRDSWRTIRDEALHLFDEGYIRAAEKHNDAGFGSFFKEGWKRFYLKWYGEPLPSAHALCPQNGRAAREHSEREGRDVRAAAARQQAQSAPRSVRRLAALSPRASSRRTRTIA